MHEFFDILRKCHCRCGKSVNEQDKPVSSVSLLLGPLLELNNIHVTIYTRTKYPTVYHATETCHHGDGKSK